MGWVLSLSLASSIVWVWKRWADALWETCRGAHWRPFLRIGPGEHSTKACRAGRDPHKDQRRSMGKPVLAADRLPSPIPCSASAEPCSWGRAQLGWPRPTGRARMLQEARPIGQIESRGRTRAGGQAMHGVHSCGGSYRSRPRGLAAPLPFCVRRRADFPGLRAATRGPEFWEVLRE